MTGKRSVIRGVLVALVTATLSSLSPAGWAEGGKGKAPASNKGGAYAEACSQGAAKYAARDFPGAVADFQKAIEASPNLPLAHYLLGEAQLAAGNLTEAEASWNRASSQSTSDASMHARVLFVLADLRERQKRWDDAKTAWQAYLDWASKNSNASAFPTSGQSRQQVIDTMMKQDKAYDVVRQRIAETKNGNVFTDLSKSPK